MLCPFKKNVTQEQSMPNSLATPEPPKVLITEKFQECDSDQCMAYDVEKKICKLSEK